MKMEVDKNISDRSPKTVVNISTLQPRDNNGRFLKGYHYSSKTEFKNGQHWRKAKPYWDKKWLYNEYVVKKKPAIQIADEQGCTGNAIFYFLYKHKIPVRKMAEIRKNKYWGLSGDDNPMYNRKGELNPNWKGGISVEKLILYGTKEWKKACSIVWERDKTTCQRCKIKADDRVHMHVHHIAPSIAREFWTDISYLVLLCKSCHHWVHSKKNIKKEYLIDNPRKKYNGVNNGSR